MSAERSEHKETSIKVISFDGKRDRFLIWIEKYKAKSMINGRLDILTRLKAMPSKGSYDAAMATAEASRAVTQKKAPDADLKEIPTTPSWKRAVDNGTTHLLTQELVPWIIHHNELQGVALLQRSSSKSTIKSDSDSTQMSLTQTSETTLRRLETVCGRTDGARLLVAA